MLSTAIDQSLAPVRCTLIGLIMALARRMPTIFAQLNQYLGGLLSVSRKGEGGVAGDYETLFYNFVHNMCFFG